MKERERWICAEGHIWTDERVGVSSPARRAAAALLDAQDHACQWCREWLAKTEGERGSGWWTCKAGHPWWNWSDAQNWYPTAFDTTNTVEGRWL